MLRALPFLLLPACIRILVRDETVTLDAPVDRVVVDVAGGDVEIVGDDVSDVRIDRHVEHTEGNAPALTAEIVDGLLTVKAVCEPLKIGVCRADHRIVLPAGVTATVFTGAGDVAVTGITGALAAETASGDIRGVDLTAAEATVETGSGDVELRFVGPLARLDLETGSGDVTLLVPGGAYALQLTTGSGDVEVSGVTDEAGGAPIQGATGSGDITVVGQ
jgi:hypothetical protein